MKGSRKEVSVRLRCLIELKYHTIQDFSDYFGISKGALEKYLNASTLPNAAFLSALHSKMKVSAHWVLDGIEPMYLVDAADLERNGARLFRQGPFNGPKTAEIEKLSVEDLETTRRSDLVSIPRFEIAATAGLGAQNGTEEQTGIISVSRDWFVGRGLSFENLVIISIRGDSMEPTLREGDLIIVDRSQTEPRDGKAFVVRVWDDLVVKNVQIIGQESISLLSANPQYPPCELKLPLQARDFEIIGRVVASMHEW